MITGYNTDVQYNGVIYHIQTEDKGLETPLVISLIYIGGTIIASKRTSYEDLLSVKFDEEVLTARLVRQHKLMCAAVKVGRIDDLKRMTVKQNQGVSSARREKIKPKPVVETQFANSLKIPKPEVALEMKSSVVQAGLSEFSHNFSDVYSERPVDRSIPKPGDDLIWEVPDSAIEDLIIEDVEIVEEVFFPADSIEIVLPNLIATEQVSIESSPPIVEGIAEEKLTINIDNNLTFKAGEQKTLEIFVNKGNNTEGMECAHILVKLIGSSFRPIIFHGKTNDQGISLIDLKLPDFKQGRAAIVIKAMCQGEESELRRTIIQN